jgi:hypothetical protein
MELKSYNCSIDNEHWSTINAISKGSAKSKYFRKLDADWIKYTQIKCKVNGYPYTSEEFIRCTKYRNIEFAYCGMKVNVSGWNGFIVGHNNSANLDILFIDGKYSGQTLNCHPNFKIKYFDKQGNLIKEY